MARSTTRTAPGRGVVPDLFRAALEDNVEILHAAMDAGGNLAEVRDESLRNPMHIAVMFGSGNFLTHALNYPEVDLWSRDYGGLRPLDHCWTKNHFDLHKILHAAMYPSGWFLDFEGHPDMELRDK